MRDVSTRAAAVAATCRAILIVEDEHHLAQGLCFNLEADGHDVQVVGDGEVALRRLLDEPAPLRRWSSST